MKVALLVVNYGSHELLVRNLPTLDAEVVIVDNFSTDAERHAIEMLCAERGWHLEKHPNIGFGTGMNRAADRARTLGCDVFLLVNPDLIGASSVFTELAIRADSDRTTMHGPTIMRRDGSVWFGGGGVKLKEGVTTTASGTDASASGGWLTGACLALHSELWARAGGFDDDYFLYWEDVDLSWRVTGAGGRLSAWKDLEVIHDVGGTQDSAGKSPTYVFYNCRNRLVFARKHLARADQIRWLIRTPTYARRVALRGGRRAFVADAARLTWAAVRGSLAGVGHVAIGLSRHNSREDVRP